MSSNGAKDLPDAETRAATPHGFTALRTGTRLDNRYSIEAVLAAGGFGITYVARHDGLGRTFAIKEHFPRQFAYRDGTTSEVKPTDPGTYKWALDRFLLEGRALARCKHPNVVDVTDVFEANQTAYMVLVYEDGQSLKSWLDHLGRPPTQAELDHLVPPLLDALEFVHSQDLLHRDLAPDNIMVRRDGKPCLIDFGAARQALAQRSQVMSAIVKTGFSPPEQYTTTGRAQGPWSDIYALGATLYRAVTGRVPTESTDRQIDDQLVPVAEAVADKDAYRPGFLAGIEAALQLKQGERPQSIAALRAILMSDGQPSAPTRVEAKIASGSSPVEKRGSVGGGLASKADVRRAGAPAASFSSLPSGGQERSAPSRASRSVGMIGAAVGGLAILGVGAYFVLRPKPPAPASVVPPTSGARLSSLNTGENPAAKQAATNEQRVLLDARAKAQEEAEKQRAAQKAEEQSRAHEAVKKAEQQRLVAEREQQELLERRAQSQAEAERDRQGKRAAESATKSAEANAPDLSAALKSLAPLLEKDKLRFARLFESRTKALERSIKNAQGDAKALAAIDAAKKLLASPTITTVPDQLIGRWRCRSISLGGSLGDGAPQFAADIGGNFECRISRDAKGLVFNKLTGSMKKLARLDLLPVDGNFVLYYGTTIAQSDPQPVYPGGDPYGHEVGLLAQLSADRLRLELSEPNHSASAGHELIELVRIK